MSRPIEADTADAGAHIDPEVVNQASEWLMKLWSGVATAEDHRACSHWRAAHAEHERAWKRLLRLEQKLDIVPRNVARQALKRPSSLSRRGTLKALAVMVAGGATADAVRRTSAWQRYSAEHSTGVGEHRALVLADSSSVTLNTASAIDVQFDEHQRRVLLKAGEILVATARDAHATPRPFVVATAQGTVRALGTRFTVRRIDDDVSRVEVFEGAVLIQPRYGTPSRQLDAGFQVTFTNTAEHDRKTTDESASTWIEGSMFAERMRLDAFIAELARYRPGVLRCDPAVAHHVLTGVYSLSDTDRILASIEKALPVKVVYRSQYWVTVTTR